MGRAWLRVIAGSADAELVGLVDLDVEAGRRAAGDAGFDVQLAGSVDELLGRVNAEAVLNVTIPTAHHAVSTAALLAGLPVLSEKPLAESVIEGSSMVAQPRSADGC